MRVRMRVGVKVGVKVRAMVLQNSSTFIVNLKDIFSG